MVRSILTSAPSRPRAREGGFTLIEVLVAILVLSFGMLGVVGLQLTAMQSNKEARYQSAGVRYARELAETMRANKNMLSVTPSPYLNMNYTDGVSAPPTYTGTCTSAAGCTASRADNTTPFNHADLANFDVADWWARAKAELPGLRVRVCQDSTPYDTNGRPVWTCTAPGSTSSGQSVFVKLAWTQQNSDRSATGTAVINQASDANSVPLVVVPVNN